jgi:hypothetical protein
VDVADQEERIDGGEVEPRATNLGHRLDRGLVQAAVDAVAQDERVFGPIVDRDPVDPACGSRE